jgi:hypothetical protein
MHGAILPLPYASAWRGALLSTRNNFSVFESRVGDNIILTTQYYMSLHKHFMNFYLQ